jgi:hypothetical protein
LKITEVTQIFFVSFFPQKKILINFGKKGVGLSFWQFFLQNLFGVQDKGPSKLEKSWKSGQNSCAGVQATDCQNVDNRKNVDTCVTTGYTPGANPTITTHNASAIKIYNAANSVAYFKSNT